MGSHLKRALSPPGDKWHWNESRCRGQFYSNFYQYLLISSLICFFKVVTQLFIVEFSWFIALLTFIDVYRFIESASTNGISLHFILPWTFKCTEIANKQHKQQNQLMCCSFLCVFSCCKPTNSSLIKMNRNQLWQQQHPCMVMKATADLSSPLSLFSVESGKEAVSICCLKHQVVLFRMYILWECRFGKWFILVRLMQWSI